MKHVIIGTAGHVDHGKTALVKALTGMDTDRLGEEKKRGITIELGFAHLDWEDGTRAGIVDVPGHEKFIKNMLAGAGGIDLALLVVAADEGFMPQTVEHLGILRLLGIREGLVVLTKTDLVEKDWLEMVREDVKAQVKGTFLEGRPIAEVSAHTGQGIPALRQRLKELVQQAGEKDVQAPFRLPVDRVFSMEGFGTVVTGTLIEGTLREHDRVELVPSGLQARVRSLQVHGGAVEAAWAGQRVAVNLAGVKKSDLRRGEALVQPGSVPVWHMLDVGLHILKSARRAVENGSQVHVYHGSGVQLAKVILLEQERLEPGDRGYAQLRFNGPAAAKIGDRLVVRFYSPVETIGGGVVLDNRPARHRRGDPAVAAALAIREKGTPEDKLLQALTEGGLALPGFPSLADRLSMAREEAQKALAGLLARGTAVELLPGRYLAASVLEEQRRRCETLLEDYHARHPLQPGMGVAQLRQKVFSRAENAVADGILERLRQEGSLEREGDRWALAGFAVRLTGRQAALRDRLLDIYRQAGAEPPAEGELWPMFPQKEREEVRQVLESLVSGGELVRLSPQLALHREVYDGLAARLACWFAGHDTLTLAQFRDEVQTSRKYALAVLEHFDRQGLTCKEGDLRKPGPALKFSNP